MPRWATLAATLLICALWPAVGDAIELRDPAPGAALEGFSVDAAVDGRYVSVTVEATISGPSLITGELRFPLPPGAVLYEAAVFVPDEDRWAIAETLGRRQGRQVFDAAPSEPRTSPLLVQQIGRDFYRAKVHAPEEAGSLRLRIRYAHLIERTEDGGYALRIALANPDLGRARPAALGLSVEAPTGWRVLGVRGPGLARIEDGEVGLVDPAHPLDEDLWVDLEPIEPLDRVGGLTYLPPAAGDDVGDAVRARLVPHSHLHFAPDLADLPEQPRRLVLVLDRSGSMSGAKMQEARRGVARVIQRLQPGDRFSIVAFDETAEVFSDRLVGVDRIDAALAFLEGVREGGGTDIFEALSAAADVAGEAADIVLITDGRPNGGITDPRRTLDALQTADLGLRIFSFGIGHDLDQGYLNALALGSGGDVAYALDDGEIAGDLFELCDQAIRGGLAEAELQIDGEAAWSGRAMPGDEIIIGWRGAAPARVELSGEAGEEVSIGHDVPPLPTGVEGLHRVAAPLVAKAISDRLEREIDLYGETADRVDAAVRIARAYGIITRYSSHLALVREDDYAERGIERVQRDPAGIALGPVDGAEEDEARIGGEGIPGDDSDGDGVADADDNFENNGPGGDAGAPPPPADEAPEAGAPADFTGCSAAVGARGAAPMLLGLLMLMLAGLIRRAQR